MKLKYRYTHIFMEEILAFTNYLFTTDEANRFVLKTQLYGILEKDKSEGKEKHLSFTPFLI